MCCCSVSHINVWTPSQIDMPATSTPKNTFCTSSSHRNSILTWGSIKFYHTAAFMYSVSLIHAWKMPLLISCQSVLQQTLKYWISDHHKSILNLRETLVAVWWTCNYAALLRGKGWLLFFYYWFHTRKRQCRRSLSILNDYLINRKFIRDNFGNFEDDQTKTNQMMKRFFVIFKIF